MKNELSTNRVKELEEKLMLENSGCWARKDADGTIQIHAQDDTPLFALKSSAIEFASEPLFIVLQAFMNGFNNGRARGITDTRNKITELIKLCL